MMDLFSDRISVYVTLKLQRLKRATSIRKIFLAFVRRRKCFHLNTNPTMGYLWRITRNIQFIAVSFFSTTNIQIYRILSAIFSVFVLLIFSACFTWICNINIIGLTEMLRYFFCTQIFLFSRSISVLIFIVPLDMHCCYWLLLYYHYSDVGCELIRIFLVNINSFWFYVIAVKKITSLKRENRYFKSGSHHSWMLACERVLMVQIHCLNKR